MGVFLQTNQDQLLLGHPRQFPHWTRGPGSISEGDQTLMLSCTVVSTDQVKKQRFLNHLHTYGICFNQRLSVGALQKPRI